MKAIAVATIGLALLVAPAHAQFSGGGGGGGGKHRHGDAQKGDAKPKVDEKAYKAALERIPDPKEKYDPWGSLKPSQPEAKSR